MDDTTALREAFQQLVNMNDNFLKLQKDFIVAINDLSNKIDKMDFTDEQSRKDLSEILDKCSLMCQRMEFFPNEDIIKEAKKITDQINEVTRNFDGCAKDNSSVLNKILEEVSKVDKGKRFIEKIVWILVLIMTLFGGIFTFWQQSNVDKFNNEIKEIKKIILETKEK